MTNNNDTQTPWLFCFDDWFQNHGGIVMIYLNENNSNSSSEDYDDFKKWALENKFWIFFKEDDKTKKLSFEYFKPNTLFLYNAKEVDLKKYANYISQIKEKWDKKNEFPDIQISQKNYDSIIVDKTNKKNHKMFLHPDVFDNFEQFRFTLGHELAHIDFPEKDFIKIINKLKFFNFDIIQILFLMNFIATTFIFIKANTITDLIASGLVLIPSLVLGFLILGSFITFKQRMFNYTKEFFCDIYSINYVGVVHEKHMGLNLDEISFYNVYSHPSNKHRVSFYKKYKENYINNQRISFDNFNPEDFKSPNLTHQFLFKYLNIYEIVFLFRKNKKKIS